MISAGQRFLFGNTSNRVKADTIVGYLFASFFVKDKIILDIACGTGFGSFFLAQEAKEVIGVDISAESVEYAKKNFPRNNLTFEAADALRWNYPKNYFDLIVSFLTIEQLSQPQKFLDLLYNSLKDNGMIILATPNKKIVSPFRKEPIGKFHKFEFYKKDLERMFRNKFKAKWYGQRCAFKLLTNYFIRRSIRVLEVLLNKKFGFYGARESYQIVPLRFWREPKEFFVILTKNGNN